MKKWLEDSGADVIVLVSDDHFNSYFYDHMPSFTIGLVNVKDGEIGRYQNTKFLFNKT